MLSINYSFPADQQIVSALDCSTLPALNNKLSLWYFRHSFPIENCCLCVMNPKKGIQLCKAVNMTIFQPSWDRYGELESHDLTRHTPVANLNLRLAWLTLVIVDLTLMRYSLDLDLRQMTRKNIFIKYLNYFRYCFCFYIESYVFWSEFFWVISRAAY